MLQPLTGMDILNLKYYTFVKEPLQEGQCTDQRNRLYRGGWRGNLF